jgi:hypothetical protein
MVTEVQKEFSNDSEVAVADNLTLDIQAEQVSAELNNQPQKTNKEVSIFFAGLSEKISRFYQEYKLPILSFALLVATIILLRVGLATLSAVSGIPFVRPFFDLVGMSYTFWFIFRYLLKDSTRKELAANFRLAKKQIVGKTTTSSN